ncbi:hypothetical protein FJZ31_19580 [Candidatus Poribacteria bacterium]|nr:hypothetical protein [Candidatus Poribacteria bacterium]
MFQWNFQNNDDNILLDDISDEEQRCILEKVAKGLVRRRLTAPAIFFLEVCKPLNFLGSQFLIAIAPFVQSLLPLHDYRKFALIIERDSNVEELITLIEDFSKKEGKGAKGQEG